MVRRAAVGPEMLRTVSLFHSLDDDQLRQISSLLRERRYRKGATIFHQDDDGNCLYIITAGHVRIYVSYPDGRESTLRIYEAGTAFGEFAVLDGRPRSASAAALDEVVTLVLFRTDFMGLLQKHFTLVESMLAQLTERLRYTTSYVEQQVSLSVPGRVAALLVQLADQATPEHPVHLKWTQVQLAAFANTSREWISRTLNIFAEQGLLQLQRGMVIVLDAARLQEHIR